MPALAASATGLLSAQQTDQPQSELKSAAPQGRIHLDVAVTSAAGNTATGLSAGDFILLDNGEPLKIVSLEPNADSHAEMIFVIDEINSTSRQVAEAKAAIASFLRRNHGQLDRPVTLYTLTAMGLTASAPHSTDGEGLAIQITQKAGPRLLWKTASQSLFPLLSRDYGEYRDQVSVQALGSVVIDQRDDPAPKLLIWTGPGWPAEVSGAYLFDWIEEFSTRLRDARIVLDAIMPSPPPPDSPALQKLLLGVHSARDAVPANLSLPVLAMQSGGQVLQASSDMATQLAQCIADLGQMYTLSFDPPRTEHVDEYHALQVKMAKPGLSARTRAGYYDEPVYYEQPRIQGQRISVAQLEQMFPEGQKQSDGDAAHKLEGVVLTERLTAARLAALEAHLPGSKSRMQLVALADEASLLQLPENDILPDAMPTLDEQREMIERTIDYLRENIPRLPNFFAERTTVGFEEVAGKNDEFWKSAYADQSLHLGDTARATVLYRMGSEVVEAEGDKRTKAGKAAKYLTSKGTFGPILTSVLAGAAGPHGDIRWEHWERGDSGPWAVFHYKIGEGAGKYEIGFCCMPVGDGKSEYRRKAPYHGEIAIDPASGAVRRVVMDTDLEPDPAVPVERFATVIEYAPVAIGGTPYMCPVHSVAMSRGRTLRILHQWGGTFGVYGPFETLLNDVVFSDYHLFRSDARILPDYDPAPPQPTAPPRQ